MGRHEGGLDRMDPGASGFIHYRHDPRNEATLSNNRSLPFMRTGAAICGSGPRRV